MANLSTFRSQSHDPVLHYRLIIFTRYPNPGTTKTRLIPALGPEDAANVQRSMTEWTVQTVVELCDRLQPQSYPLQVDIRFTGGNLREMQDWLGHEWSYSDQGEGDLGQKLLSAFKVAFDQGAVAALAIGIDCPSITSEILTKAYNTLKKHDVVIGPADDGGYYLIGLCQPISELFEHIEWGTETVRQTTLSIARQFNLSIAQLPVLPDIDRPEDLIIWQQLFYQRRPQQENSLKSGQVSIVIPSLNESENISRTLQPLRKAALSADIDIIVVDGGSKDDTLSKVTNIMGTKVRVLSSSPGRANQMNAGAAIATGEYLLFLHADTQLPTNFVEQIHEILIHPQHVAGAFELSIQGPNPKLRWIEWGVKWRSHLFQMPYGDQAIFLRTSTFREIGGFPRMPIMEDYEFICRLKQRGKVAIAPYPVTTSARRWQKLGVWRTTFLNQLIVLSYKLRISPKTLAKWYGRKD